MPFYQQNHSLPPTDTYIPYPPPDQLGFQKEMSAEESKWSHLPTDILNLLADRLKTINDENDICTLSFPVTTLRAVCKSWRYSILPPTISITTIVVPGTLPEKTTDRYRNPGKQETLSLTTVCLLHQPPSQSPSSSLSTKPTNWLLRLEHTNDLNKYRVLNPLYSVWKLPESFPESINVLDYSISHIDTSYTFNFHDTMLIDRVVVSTSRPLVAMAISEGKLYFLRIGDDITWNAVDDESKYQNVVFSKGKFYAVDGYGRTMSFSGPDFKASEIVPRDHRYFRQGRLVDVKGELYLVDRYEADGWADDDFYVGDYRGEAPLDFEYHFFDVFIYKLNKEERKWERANNLNGHVFFLGSDGSYSVPVRDFPGLEPDFVFICDWSFDDVNEKLFADFVDAVGVYSLDERKCKALAGFYYLSSLFFPPNWH